MDGKKKILLFLDKDSETSKKYNDSFSDTEFNVFFVEEPEKAIEIFDNYTVDIMIFDLNISEPSGFGFIQYIKEHYPETLRIILSGECDRKEIMRLIDNNMIKLHILKPCTPNDLKNIIVKVHLLYEGFKSEGLQRVISDLPSLPTLPDLYRKITDMVERDSNIEEISKVIEEDQSIASRVLKMSNSAFYAAKTGSIQVAIMFIGLSNVKNIVLTNSVFKEIGTKRPEVGMSWRHVSLTNKLLGKVYKFCYGKNIPLNYASVGLLHDIGKVVFLSHFGDKYEDLLVRVNNEVFSEDSCKKLVNLEKEMFGTDHQRLGAYLMDWWGLPLPIVEAARYHHEPLDENILNKELVLTVHLSSYYASKFIYGENNRFMLNEDVFKHLKINRDELEKAVEDMKITDLAELDM